MQLTSSGARTRQLEPRRAAPPQQVVERAALRASAPHALPPLRPSPPDLPSDEMEFEADKVGDVIDVTVSPGGRARGAARSAQITHWHLEAAGAVPQPRAGAARQTVCKATRRAAALLLQPPSRPAAGSGGARCCRRRRVHPRTPPL